MTGTNPSAISFLMSFTFTSATSPTKPRSMAPPSSSSRSFWHTSTVSPGSPFGRAPAAVSGAQTSLFTPSSSVFLTMAIVASSVTRSPFTKLALSPDSSIALVIAFPPPCTTTTLMPTPDRNAMSWATRARLAGSGSSMKLPPYFTTKVAPRKSWMYGSASRRTFAFAVTSATSNSVLTWPARRAQELGISGVCARVSWAGYPWLKHRRRPYPQHFFRAAQKYRLHSRGQRPHISTQVQHIDDLRGPLVPPRGARGAVGDAGGMPRRDGAVRLHPGRGA